MTSPAAADRRPPRKRRGHYPTAKASRAHLGGAFVPAPPRPPSRRQRAHFGFVSTSSSPK